MKKVVVLGAGLSSRYLIQHLESIKEAESLELIVADKDKESAQSKCHHPDTQVISIDILNNDELNDLISGSSLVVSMLPAFLHIKVAQLCLENKINLATASYLSKEIKALHDEVKSKGLIFLNECGLDPGIDHLSAMKMLDEIRAVGGNIKEFESFTGGLIAPAYENNAWRYKFTWNPRNVVLASSGGAVKFIHNGKYKYIPYHKVFRRTERVLIDGYGKFEGYANRDSLKYRKTYGLQDVKTMFRGTFRRPGFSKAWNCFVAIGATDDSYVIHDSENMTYRDFINTFLPYHPSDSVENKLRQYLQIDQDDVDLWEKLTSLDIFSNTQVGIKNATPAKILQKILEEKWSLDPEDKDMIVMWHKVTYTKDNMNFVKESSLVVEGKDRHDTAMAKTVGLPLALACELILQDKVTEKGCLLPITPEYYLPILSALEKDGVVFTEKMV